MVVTLHRMVRGSIGTIVGETAHMERVLVFVSIKVL